MQQKNDIRDFLLILTTCLLAPLFTHFLSFFPVFDLTIWTSERVMALCFSGYIGYVISDKFERIVFGLKRRPAWLRLGDAKAIKVVVWALCPLLICFGYDDVFCVLLTFILFGVACVILVKDDMAIKAPHVCISGLCAIAVGFIAYFFMPKLTVGELFYEYAIGLGIFIVLALLIDLTMHLMGKCKTEQEHSDEK